MASRKSREPQKCIPVINDIHDENFAAETEKFDEELPDPSIYTSIWKNPDRLQIAADYSLLLATLSRECHVESSYSETLLVLKTMKKSEKLAKIDGKIDAIFSFLLMQMLKEENVKKMDSHVMLDWLDAGDRLFTGKEEKIKKSSYAVLKLYFLCRNRKAKLECFSCGCVQKYFIHLYTENSNCRLIGALNSLITGKLADFNPILKKLFLQLPEISSIEYYEYYIELLDELEMCSVIDKSDEKQHLQRVIQLIGLLSELRLEDVPKACSKLYTLMGQFSAKGDGKKKQSVIESVVRNKLLPKIFDSLSAGNSKSLDLTRESVQKMTELVINEKYSYAQQANVMFAPLQFLNRILAEFDVWDKSWPVLKLRLDSLKMSNNNTSSIIFLYFLSLIFRNDPSLVGCLVEYLELQYQNTTIIGVKKTILILLEIMEQLADSSAPSFSSYFKENHSKNRLILEEKELEIPLDYIQNFTPNELNQFLAARKSLKSDEFSALIEKLKDVRISIQSDEFWRVLLEKMDENSMNFVENQLKLLANRQDRKHLHSRIDQIFKITKFPPKSMEKATIECFYLRFPRFLMTNFDEEQWKVLLPTNTTVSLISALIFAFLTVFDGNELEICRLFHRLHTKINPNSPLDSSRNPLEILQMFCEKIREKQVQGVIEIGFLKEMYDEASPEKKERILEVSAILWSELASEFQKFGDANGRAPFCQLATMIDEFLKKNLPENDVDPIENSKFQIWRQICEKTMDGYVRWWTDKWNWLFVSRKIWTVLQFTASKDRELMEKMMRMLNKNQALLSKLRATNKEFVQLEQSLNF